MTQAEDRDRLDRLLVRRGLYATRARARDAIVRGTVMVDGTLITKPAFECAADAAVTVDDPASGYASRGALKLLAALDAFEVPIKGATCLDIGASTGGFTQVLLERGAGRVHAIDVGHGQMDKTLATDARVRLIEKLNARDLTAGHLDGERPALIVCDVSFISLELALPPALSLAAPGAHLVALVKPQFEVGKAKIGKGGLVAPEDAHRAARDLRRWLDDHKGWRSRALAPSPITGGDGNAEFLLWGVKDKTESD